MVVNMGSRYGLEGLGSKPLCEIVTLSSPFPSRPALGPIQTPLQWVSRQFPGNKAAAA
jgi:hypothetical protein